MLICEPHDDITALLELVVRRLGHEPALHVPGSVPDPGTVDIAVIEPGDACGIELAHALSDRHVPLLFTSIYPPDEELLALAPTSYLVKPFPLYALERALGAALAVDERAPAAAAV